MLDMGIRWPLIIVTLLPVIVDFVVTSYGQPSGYWLGIGDVNEAGPIPRALLMSGYQMFVVGEGLYTLVVAMFLRFLSHRLFIILSIVIYSAHLSASSTWAHIILFKFGVTNPDSWYYYTIIYQIILGVIYALILNLYFKKYLNNEK